MQKNFCYILSCFLALITLKPIVSNAQNAAGGELIYEHLSDSTYRFFFKFYRDCGGPAEPTSFPLCFRNTCTNSGFNTTMNKWPALQQGQSIKLPCSQYKSKCEDVNSTVDGVQVWWYYAVVTMPAQCSNWKFFTYGGNRNMTNNLQNPTNTTLYIEGMMNNTGLFMGNTSAYYSVPAIAYICNDQPFTYNNGAVDPDGDSVVTELIRPMTGVSSCTDTAVNVPFATANPGISIPNNPFQTNNTFALNPVTGQISFTPKQLGPSNLAVRVKEYRNGVLISSTMRESQIQVLACNAPVGPPVIKSDSFPTIWQPGAQYQACIGKPLTINWDIVSQNPNAQLILSDNGALSLGGNVFTAYTNQRTDSVRGVLNWTPTKSGMYYFLISAKDSTCEPPGIMITYAYQIAIFVWGPTTVAASTNIICAGDSVQLSANGGGIYTWTELPSGSTNSLNTSSGPNPVAFPSVTTQYAVVSGVNAFCPLINKDTVTIEVLDQPTVSITANPDTNVWPGLNVTFTAAAINCSSPTYQWRLNGADISGATASTYNTTALNDQDVITCVMSCSDTCITDTPSNALIMHVATSVKDIAKINHLNIFPNPNAGSFTLTGFVQAKGVMTIEIFNAMGQLVYTDGITSANGQLNKQLRIGNLPAGVYQLRLKSDNDVRTLSLSIQK